MVDNAKIMEIWKDVVGYEGLYQVSNLGNIKSLSNNKTRKERILKPVKSNRGYYQVNLYKNNKGKMIHIHKLVIEHFSFNVFNYPQINHIDEDKLNNKLINLEWCTAKENCNHGTRNKRVGGKKKIIQKDLNNNIIKSFSSIKEASNILNIPYNSIRNCLQGYYIDTRVNKRYNINHTNGFIFNYE